MQGFIQIVCVLAIAVGSGLIAFGSKLEPQLNVTEPATMSRMLDSFEDRNQHYVASITSGVGSCLLILGILGLVVPWVNKLGTAITSEMSDNSARTIATISVWLSVATILTFGIFRMHWTGALGMSVLLMIVALICVTATIASAMIFGWKPWSKAIGAASEKDGQSPS